MFKRKNKITSLLIAAASIISIVPASAADVKKIDTLEGTIYNAEIFAGNMFIEGEINDKDAAYYYNASDGKYTCLDNVDSGDSYIPNPPYITIGEDVTSDGGDYTLDLTNGKVTEGDLYEDNVNDSLEKLRKNIKKDTKERYSSDETSSVQECYEIVRTMGNKYIVSYTNADTASKDAMKTLYIAASQDGSYVDLDYDLGKIKVSTTSSAGNATVSIENSDDEYKLNSSSNISAKVSYIAPLLKRDGQNLYRFAKITITADSGNAINSVNGVNITGNDTVYEGGGTNEVSYIVLQKISFEAATDDIHGASYSKSVTNYTISDKEGKHIEDTDILNTDDLTAGDYSIINGKLIGLYKETDDSGAYTGKIKFRTYGLKGSNGYYYTDESDSDTVDVEVSDDQGPAYDLGDQFIRLDGGYIYNYDVDNSEWEKLYKVDGSFNEFEHEGINCIIAWNEDDGVYSIIEDNKSTTANAAAATTTTESATTTQASATVGWVNTSSGWTYYDGNSVQVKDKWVNDKGVWYMIKADGIMAIGWYDDKGTWYYLYESGAMAANTTIDGYVLGENGALIQ